MIFWSGLGYLIAIGSFIVFLTTEFLVELYFKDEEYYQTEGWPIFLAFCLCGTLCRLLGAYIERKENRRLIDIDSGDLVIQKPTHHTLFFVPIRYWTYIMPVIGLAFYITYILKK